MLVAARLIDQDYRFCIFYRSYVAEGFTEASVAETVRTPKELNGIIDAERRQRELHGAVVLVAQRQNVGSHRLSLASEVPKFSRKEESARGPAVNAARALERYLQGPVDRRFAQNKAATTR